MWAEIRYRLLVLALAGVVTTGLWVGLHAAVRVGPISPYEPPTFSAYSGDVLAWSPAGGVAGTVQSHLYVACPDVVAWVVGADGHPLGLVDVGALGAQRATSWSGFAIDVRGQRLRLQAKPVVRFACAGQQAAA